MGTRAARYIAVIAALQCVKMVGDVTVPNSLAWNFLQERTTDFSDTYKRVIFAYEFDIEDGALGRRRVFTEFPDRLGGPDGSTVDADGYLWTAVYGGGRLHR